VEIYNFRALQKNFCYILSREGKRMELLGIMWEKILVGLIAGGLVSAFYYVKNKIQDKYLERKFPISGEYITKFEDEKDGKKVLCVAPATLKQKGNKVYGENIMDILKRDLMGEKLHVLILKRRR